MTFPDGTIVDGKYRVISRLGAGGMGEVYKVEHLALGATRVIKVIRAQISESTDAHERFLREARLATKVQHPNVATLHDFSALADGSHYMVWEFIEGQDLGALLRARGTLPPRYAVSLCIQALRGLDAIHRAGIVHRDVSPENLMITRDGADERVRIIDLGVAKSEESNQAATRVGVFVGKLRYASPEHLGFLEEGERIDGRADLYSMAIVLYEMLAGRPPFEARSPHEYVLRHAADHTFTPPALAGDLPGGDALKEVLRRALERDRNRRFPTAAAFAAALEEVFRALPAFDPDATVRTAPADEVLHRTTVRTSVPPPAIPAPAGVSRTFLVSLVTFSLLLGGGLAALFLLPRREPVPVPATAARPPTPQATIATSAIEVKPTVSEETTAATVAAIEQPAPEKAPPRKAVESAPEKPAESAAPEPPPSSARAYVDGGSGDSDSNERRLEQLRDQLRGVTRIAVRGGDADLLRQLRAEVADHVEVSDDADVVIDFRGAVLRLGGGRKQRSAQATITKRGREIFRYEYPPEVYRMGDNPAEAFWRVLSDAWPE